jgi:hypothetical protein
MSAPDRSTFVPDATEEQWPAAKVFDRSVMKMPRLLVD